MSYVFAFVLTRLDFLGSSFMSRVVCLECGNLVYLLLLFFNLNIYKKFFF